MTRTSRIPFVIAATLALAACGNDGGGDAPPPETMPPPAATAPDSEQPAIPPMTQPAAVLDWNNLDAAVGKYATDIDFFAPGPIPDALRELLGDDFARLQDDLAVAGPLQKEGGIYYLTGNAQHRGGLDQAYVLIDPSQRALEVGLWRDGTLGVYVTPGAADIDKPVDVTTLIANTEQAPAPASSSGEH